MSTRPCITVVGGANTDIVGIPEVAFALHDSIPGHVRVSAGGVGRNIAENLARLGARVRLVTVFGADAASEALAIACEEAGIDTSFSIRVPDVPGSTYLAVLDASGDLAAAVNDMRALALLGPEALDPAAFSGADAVVLDTNLPASTIARAAALAAAPIVLDPVSVPKSAAALPVLGLLSAIKPNLREAEALSGARGAEASASALLALGVARVFLTMGADGVVCASADGLIALQPLPAAVANVTGAGDAFTAGVAWGTATGMTVLETAELALALSAITLESERTVSDHVSGEALRERMEARA